MTPSDIERLNNHIRFINNSRSENDKQNAIAMKESNEKISIALNLISPMISNGIGLFGPIAALFGKLIGVGINEFNSNYIKNYHKSYHSSEKLPLYEPDLKVISEIPIVKFKI
jgi:hypothetical protein